MNFRTTRDSEWWPMGYLGKCTERWGCKDKPGADQLSCSEGLPTNPGSAFMHVPCYGLSPCWPWLGFDPWLAASSIRQRPHPPSLASRWTLLKKRSLDTFPLLSIHCRQPLTHDLQPIYSYPFNLFVCFNLH